MHKAITGSVCPLTPAFLFKSYRSRRFQRTEKNKIFFPLFVSFARAYCLLKDWHWKMLSKLVLAIFIVSSPAFGLLQTLYQNHADCYNGCQTNYAATTSHWEACKKGCDMKLYNQNCIEQCPTSFTDEALRTSCLVGCSMMPENLSPAVNNPERPRSIILIRLRQRPSLQFPTLNDFFNKNPADLFNDLIKQWKTETEALGQPNDLAKSNEWKTVVHFVKAIPLLDSASGVRADSSSESSEETLNSVKHVFVHHAQGSSSLRERFQQWTQDIHQRWNHLVAKQPSMPIWILLGFFICLSAFFWYMIVSLCSHAPTHRTLSLQAQELFLENADDKEKLIHVYQSQETLPVKVKLTNI